MKFKSKFIAGLFLSASLLAGTSCNTSRTARGAGAGAGTGAVIGGIIGNNSGNTAKGAVIGAAIGGVAGGAIGKYMDKQKEKMEKDLGEDAKIERVGEGIQLTFDSGILFKVGSSKLSPLAKTDLEKLAGTLKEYPETNIIIDGHTDSTGGDALNLKLSQERAKAVHDYMVQQGVMASRLMTVGHGETSPVASNDTEAGRAMNRRVEIGIMANEKLKKDAEDGTVEGR